MTWTIMNAILTEVGQGRVPLDVRLAGAQTVLREIHAPGEPFLGAPIRVSSYEITLTINVEATGLKLGDPREQALFQRSAFNAALGDVDVPAIIDGYSVIAVPAAVYADPFNEPVPTREIALEAVRNLVELLIAVADIDVGAAWCYALRLPIEVAGAAYRDIHAKMPNMRDLNAPAAFKAYAAISRQLGERLA